MQVKNAYSHQGILAIGDIVASILSELARAVLPGATTAGLDALAAKLLRAHGAEATPHKEFGFPARLCVSVNDEVVHGLPGPRILQPGDLVKIDLTADKNGYVADAARTIAVAPASDTHLLLAETARRACAAAAAVAKPGSRLTDLGAAIQREADRHGFRIVRELCGHGVGRRTHELPEVPNFADDDNHAVLREGTVIAVEPILTTGSGMVRRLADGWTVVTADGAPAAHHEETILIGADGAEVVTACR